MSKKLLYYGIVVLVALAIGTFYLSDSISLQGRFGGKTTTGSTTSTSSTTTTSTTSSSLLRVSPGNGSMSGETQEYLFSDYDLEASDDVSSVMDDYDKSWINIGSWKLAFSSKAETCPGSYHFSTASASTGEEVDLSKYFQELRITVKDGDGNAYTKGVNPGEWYYRSEDGTYGDPDMSTFYSLNLPSTSPFTLTLAGRPNGTGMINQLVYMDQVCVVGFTEGGLSWSNEDTSKESYFDLKLDSTKIGVHGGYSVFMH